MKLAAQQSGLKLQLVETVKIAARGADGKYFKPYIKRGDEVGRIEVQPDVQPDHTRVRKKVVKPAKKRRLINLRLRNDQSIIH